MGYLFFLNIVLVSHGAGILLKNGETEILSSLYSQLHFANLHLSREVISVFRGNRVSGTIENQAFSVKKYAGVLKNLWSLRGLRYSEALSLVCIEKLIFLG
ncbi:MAG: hypothetical protein CVV44_02245 [Spirochaetae bacterium HGW-Spirochaetae-1]|jgi:hypothetical protein|nr:MAG: hypothetical protein CVV44_02245 [Spirochaetae bacterium HGW-Spirochaetae-1]